MPHLSLPIAHGLVGKADLPLPVVAFVIAAAVVLIVSFAAMAFLWTRSRLEEPRERPLFGLPLAFDVVAGVFGVFVFAVVVYAGLAGVDQENANLASTAIFVVMWVGVPFLSLLLGDVWNAVSPWRAVGRAFGWAAARLAPGGLPPSPEYPARLGYWPAAAGVVAFGWIELVWPSRSSPQALAIAGLLYFVVMLVGQSLYGVEPWNRRGGDALGAYFRLFARLAPLGRNEDGTVVRRRPLHGLGTRLDSPAPAGFTALVIAAIGVTAFDGFKEGRLFLDVVPTFQRDIFVGLGLSLGDALTLTYTLGLAASIGFVASLYALGALGMGRLRNTSLPPMPAFAHTLIPIAAAYIVAHYFSLLAYQGQAMFFLISDPLGNGSDLFGTAGTQIDYSVVSINAIWYVQVASLVIGHVAALLLAHDRAIAATGSARDATRTQVIMLIVMVCFTVLGLWLLSESN